MLKNTLLLLIILFSSSSYCKAQLMNSKIVVDNLAPFCVSLENIKEQAQATTGATYIASLEQAYSFIQLELRDTDEQVFFQVKYQIQFSDQLSYYDDPYCEDKKLGKRLKKTTDQFIGCFKWQEQPTNNFKLSPEQTKYLEIADRIAALSNDMPNTRPSYYSKVIITADFIRLEQINHWNSRSLDHKDSYFLRDLYFVIPQETEKTIKKSDRFGVKYIGEMEVFFSDGSAEKRRDVGDKIRLQIKEELDNYCE